MKISKMESWVKGVPDYYQIYQDWWLRYEETGNMRHKNLALHYARVAEEMGQALIEDDSTQEDLLHESR